MASQADDRDTIGFIGLGQMGTVMAENLLAAGYGLRVYNRTAERARPLVERGAVRAQSPQDAARRGGIVITIVSDDAALDAVATDALAQALGPGGVHISMSTILPATSERLAAHHARFGATYVAAPVFGRPEAAAARKLWICTSGKAEAKARIKPLLDAMGQGIYDFGEAIGAANVVKLTGNFLLTAAIEAMAESSALAEKCGIPRADLLHFFTQTLFNCPIYNNYAGRIIKADFDNVGFPLRLALKDMNLVQQVATGAHVPTPTLGLIRDRLLAGMATGRGELDTVAFVADVAANAGLRWGETE